MEKEQIRRMAILELKRFIIISNYIQDKKIRRKMILAFKEFLRSEKIAKILHD